MTTFSRRIVVDSDFETAVGDLCRALRDEGMQTIARIDVREHFWRDGHDFRRYMLLEAWSPDLAFEALRLTLDAGPLLTTTIAVYELADGEAVVATRDGLATVEDDPAWRNQDPGLVSLADFEHERIGRVLARLRGVAVAQPVSA